MRIKNKQKIRVRCVGARCKTPTDTMPTVPLDLIHAWLGIRIMFNTHVYKHATYYYTCTITTAVRSAYR